MGRMWHIRASQRSGCLLFSLVVWGKSVPYRTCRQAGVCTVTYYRYSLGTELLRYTTSTCLAAVRPKQCRVPITQSHVRDYVVGNHYLGSCTAYTVKQCEKIDLKSPDMSWKALPDMKGSRCRFNPCLFNEYVFLCGGNHSYLIEAISPQTDTFLPLRLALPISADSSCVYESNNYLTVLSTDCLTQFSAQQDYLTFHSLIRCAKPVDKSSNSQPQLDPSRSLCFILQRDRCVSFHMYTGVLVNVFP